MPCVRLKGFGGPAVLCVAGDEYRILIDGAVYAFEWHSYFGPIVLGKRGSPLAAQPGKVLKAASLWNQQGRQVDGDGFCLLVWDPADTFPPPGFHVERIAGRHYLLVWDGAPASEPQARRP